MSQSRHTRIMITSGGGPGVWGLLHALRTLPGRSATVIVQDPDPEPTFGTQLADEAANLPPASDSTYVDCLIRFCRRRHVDLLIPVFDGELAAIGWRREELERIGTTVLLPPTDLVEACGNKWRLHARLADTEFLPDHRLVTTPERTQDAIDELGYPRRRLCVRPVDLAGGRGLHFLDPEPNRFEQRLLAKPGPIRCTADEFMETRRCGPDEFPLVISEYLPGEDLGIDLLADDGEVIELVVRRKRGPLFHGNPMRFQFAERDGERHWVERLSKELKLSGLLCIDARYDHQHRLRLVEINPRPSACIGLSCARVHLSAWAIDLALGDHPIDPASYYADEPAESAVRALAEAGIGPGARRLLSPEPYRPTEMDDHARALPGCAS